MENHADIVRWLIAHGANPNGADEDGSPLHDAAQLGHTEVCRTLLTAGADPNQKDHLTQTPLHKASSHGYTAIIELLLESGADPTIPDDCGELPIDQALPRKRDEIHAIFNRHHPPADNVGN